MFSLSSSVGVATDVAMALGKTGEESILSETAIVPSLDSCDPK